MLNTIFRGIFDTDMTSVISPSDFLLCVGCALVIGLILAASYMYGTKYTKSFVASLALLPAVVCVVIMMVNGNVGAGGAGAGAFSLVRFRSVPGTAKEIGVLFLAMCAGIITGMGYIGYAFVFVIILGLANMFYAQINFGEKNVFELNKTMRVTIPENLDYSDIFDDIFERYTNKYQLVNVKTANMGSMFKLTYNITFKDCGDEKKFIDEIRCRNGNLEVSVSCQESSVSEVL